jgi:hypothetical protein
VPSLSTLPDIARQAAWNALWARLLAPFPDDGDSEPEPADASDFPDDEERPTKVA